MGTVKKKRSILTRVRNYFIAGIVVLIPIGITVYFTIFLISVSSKILPKEINPNHYLPYDIPGLEIIISFILITFIGWLSLSFIGKRLLILFDNILKKIPILRTIYSAIGQMTDTFTSSENKRNSVVLVEYPRKGSWAVGFATKDNTGEISDKTNKKLVITGDGYYTDKYVLKLKQLAKNNANIIFTGNQGGKSLRELFTNTYLFVQPSTSEGLSIALLEAMASKNAVLVSDIKENKEVIGRTNFSFKNKNVLSLQQKLNYLLKNKNKIQKEKLKSIKRIKSEYNWQTITNDTIKTYRNAIFKKQSKINVNLINSLMFQTNLKSKSRPTT